MGDGAPGGVGGGDVETLDAEVSGTLGRWHFLAGQDTDQLLGATGRVERRHLDDLEGFAERLDCGTHGIGGFRLVVLDADQHLFRLQQVAENADAADDLVGAFAHQQVVAGDEGLALGTVDHQFVHWHRFRCRQLAVGRENRATEADHARLLQALAHLFRCQGTVIDGFAGNPFILAIRFDDDAQRVETRRVRLHMHGDLNHGARGRGMDGGRNPAIRLADQLTLEHPVAGLNHRTRGAADALVQRHDKARR